MSEFLKCVKCKINSVLTIDGQCVIDTNIKNCVLSRNEDYCLKCS